MNRLDFTIGTRAGDYLQADVLRQPLSVGSPFTEYVTLESRKNRFRNRLPRVDNRLGSKDLPGPARSLLAAPGFRTRCPQTLGRSARQVHPLVGGCCTFAAIPVCLRLHSLLQRFGFVRRGFQSTDQRIRVKQPQVMVPPASVEGPNGIRTAG